MTDSRITASFVSLGCFKNIVDTEVVGGFLEKKGIQIVSSYEQSDWIIINTCGFIRDAKEESIEEIFNAMEKKDKGEVKHIAVIGCLIQRYLNDLKTSFKNADILWGVNDIEELADLIVKNKKTDYKDKKPFLYNETLKRIITTTPNVTFIKISEGCNMTCSFCAIPHIRGPYRSRPIDSIIKEASTYKKMGFQEINLISQNSTYFGREGGGKSRLPELLKEISKLNFKWIRILYLMPEEVNENIDEMIESFCYPSIVHYFDLPFQHVSRNILRRMKRGGGFEKNLKLLKKIRKKFNDAVIRSTFIVGFPGETKKDFEELVTFSKESGIERTGVFGFSEEEDTEAFKFKNVVPPELIEERKEILMDISSENIKKYNQSIRHSTQEFLPLGPWDNNTTIGRIKYQAPEVDGFTQISHQFENKYGIYEIKITDHSDEILFGEKI